MNPSMICGVQWPDMNVHALAKSDVVGQIIARAMQYVGNVA